MKILITGGAGFIGSNLLERLLNECNDIVVMDKERNDRLPSRRDYSFIHDDINNLQEHMNMFNDMGAIYHLAASANIRDSASDTYTDLENNVIGTYNILELMRKKDIERLIYTSTSAVYGDGPIPMYEDMKDIRPISLYGASKLATESYINAYVDMYEIKASIFRFANVIGKNEHRGVIPDFVEKLKKNKNTLEILGNGKQTKSYFYVDDCVDALMTLEPTKPASIYNIATTDTVTVTRLADIVCNEVGLEPTYKYTGGDRGWIGDVPVTVMSIDKAIENGWKPKYNCEESIRKTVRWLIGK